MKYASAGAESLKTPGVFSLTDRSAIYIILESGFGYGGREDTHADRKKK